MVLDYDSNPGKVTDFLRGKVVVQSVEMLTRALAVLASLDPQLVGIFVPQSAAGGAAISPPPVQAVAGGAAFSAAVAGVSKTVTSEHAEAPAIRIVSAKNRLGE